MRKEGSQIQGRGLHSKRKGRGEERWSLSILQRCGRWMVPGDHLLLLVGGVSAAAQVLIGGGEEVQAVVLEVLVDERKENLREGDDFR